MKSIAWRETGSVSPASRPSVQTCWAEGEVLLQTEVGLDGVWPTGAAKTVTEEDSSFTVKVPSAFLTRVAEAPEGQVWFCPNTGS